MLYCAVNQDSPRGSSSPHSLLPFSKQKKHHRFNHPFLHSLDLAKLMINLRESTCTRLSTQPLWRMTVISCLRFLLCQPTTDAYFHVQFQQPPPPPPQNVCTHDPVYIPQSSVSCLIQAFSTWLIATSVGAAVKTGVGGRGDGTCKLGKLAAFIG